MRALILSATFAALLTACTSAPPAAADAAVPFAFSGNWSGLFVSQLSRAQSTLTLTQTGASVSGNLALAGGIMFTGQVANNYVKTTGTATLRDGGSCAFILRALGETRNDSIQVNLKFVQPCPDAGLQNPEWNGVVFRD